MINESSSFVSNNNQGSMFKISYDPRVGRYLMATREIEPGEVIIDEPSLIDGPSIDKSLVSSTFNASSKNNSWGCNLSNTYVCPACYKKLPDVDQIPSHPADLSLSETSDPFSKSGSFTQCSSCNLILCSVNCTKSVIHSINECLIFSQVPALLETVFRNPSRRSLLCQFITTIRCLFMKQRNAFKWNQLLQLQSNWQELELCNVFVEIDEGFALLTWNLFGISNGRDANEQKQDFGTDDHIKEGCQIKDTADDDIVHTAHVCLGILRTNAFSLYTADIGVERVFFLTSFMSHSCVMNTERVFSTDEDPEDMCTNAPSAGGRMITRSAVNIKPNESITTTYLSYLASTNERQNDMKRVWNFNCICKRCQDPTECGTNVSTVKCPVCSVITLSPFYDTTTESCTWTCSNPNCLYSSSDELEIEIILENTIHPIESKKPQLITNLDEIEDWLDTYDDQKLVHANHSLFLQVKYFLSEYYGNEVENGLIGLSLERLMRKIKYCKQTLNVFDKLFDGIYLFKGTVLFHLWLSVKELVARRGNSHITLEKEMQSHVDMTSSAGLELEDKSSTTFAEETKDLSVTSVAKLAYHILQHGRKNSSEELLANVLLSNETELMSN